MVTLNLEESQKGLTGPLGENFNIPRLQSQHEILDAYSLLEAPSPVLNFEEFQNFLKFCLNFLKSLHKVEVITFKGLDWGN